MVFEPGHIRPKIISEQALVICFHKDQILIEKNTPLPILLLNKLLDTHFQGKRTFYVGKVEGNDLYALTLNEADVEPTASLMRDFSLVPIKTFLEVLEDPWLDLVRRSKHLVYWDKITLYCGKCGHETSLSERETAKVCQPCQRTIYPNGSPAIIVLIEKEEKILLARSPHFAPGLYSALAGFIEPGESAEDAVRREVKEEVGIEIKNIHYFGTQYWPFPDIFMVGFTAQHAKGELEINPTELEDAQWFTVDSLPKLPPISSIGRNLIESTVKRKLQQQTVNPA
jgi:NAD+ diphosphatase